MAIILAIIFEGQRLRKKMVKIKSTLKELLNKHSKLVIFFLGVIITVLVGVIIGIVLVYQKGFPQIERLEDIQPKVMTVIHDDDGKPIKEFAIEKRTIVSRADIPDVLVKALVASEDNQFYSHWGINFRGTIRAIVGEITGKRRGGGSSITQQLALNLFLNRENTYKRKFQEILLAIQIERRYSKDQILTFYCNKIWLGGSIYGVEAASWYYFGKSVRDISLAEAALLTTIIPSPNGKFDIYRRPENCLRKRDYILKRMLEMEFINSSQYKDAIKQALPKKPFKRRKEQIGNHFVEEVRKYIKSKHGDDLLYTGGLKVDTTLNVEMQEWAEDALRESLRRLDKRIGWRRKPGLFNLIKNKMDPEKDVLPSWKRLKIKKDNIVEGVVLRVNNNGALVRIGNYKGRLAARKARWTRMNLSRVLKKGDVALFKILELPKALEKFIQEDDGELSDTERLLLQGQKYRLKLGLEQEPEVEGAVIVVDNRTGEIKAMVGGYSFARSEWNNATQALRQTGSTIKPIVYTAALENGFSPAHILNDEYFSYVDPWSGELWEPSNHEDDFLGPLTVRRGFEKSRNVITARIAEYITPQKIVDYCRKFGVTSKLRPYMAISLGAFEITLKEMVAAYTVFPNLGFRVKPFLVRRIVDRHGDVLEENHPDRKQVINQDTAYVMNYLMQGVVQYGTGRKARLLEAPIGGKTGTTNDFTNAWFVGFSPSITVGVWVGYDQPRKLGNEETGSRAALPVFVKFMEKYLESYPEPAAFVKPPGVVWVNIDKYTGKLATPDCLHTFKEAFIVGTEPLHYCTEQDHQLINDYFGDAPEEEEEEEPIKPVSQSTSGQENNGGN